MEKKFEKNESVETSFDEKNLIALKKKNERQEKRKIETDELEIQNSKLHSHKKTSLLSIDYLNLLFYSKEFVAEWLTKLSFQPTPFSVISSTTISIIAICSTIQRKEGDRWFAFLSNIKMPGYNMLYQEVSWETFQNIKSAGDLAKGASRRSAEPATQVKPIQPYQLCEAELISEARPAPLTSQNQRSWLAKQAGQYNGWLAKQAAKSNGSSNSDLTKIKSQQIPLREQRSGEQKEKKYRNAYDKEIATKSTQFFNGGKKKVSSFKSRSISLETGIQSKYNSSPFSILKYVDFYKDKALIFLNSPFEKQVRKNFIGFYAKKATKENIVLPWYRIDACNRYSRTILPEFKKNFGLSERSSLLLLVSKERLSASLTSVAGSGWDSTRFREKAKQAFLPEQNLADHVRGFDYLCPFYKSKVTVYAENDSIPFKLESPYSIVKIVNTGEIVPTTALVGTTFPQKQTLLNQRRNQLLAKLKYNKTEFSGKYVTTFQKTLQNLFSIYGISPAKAPILLCKTEFLESNANRTSVPFVTKRESELLLLPERSSDKVAALLPLERPRSYSKAVPATQVNDQVAVKQATASKKNDISKKTHDALLDLSSNSNLDALVDELCFNAANLTQSHQTTSASSWLDLSLGQWNLFKQNNLLPTRLMSGYKLPEYTKIKTHSLFRKFIVPKLLISSWLNFPYPYLIDKVVLLPLYIKLPPTLPFSFFTNVASSLTPPVSMDKLKNKSLVNRYPMMASSFKADLANQTKVPVPLNSAVLYPCETRTPKQKIAKNLLSHPNQNRVDLNLQNGNDDQKDLFKEIGKGSHITIKYKQLSLPELKEIKDIFIKLGRDYENYLSLPKDSAPAMRISPSLEDDKILKLEAERKEKKDDEKGTKFEQLQLLRERERKIELGKKLRPFAYKNQLASESYGSSLLVDNSNFSEKNTNEEKSWIRFRLGSENLLSDRKFHFFGRKDILTKRLIAQEEKEINQQIMKSSYHGNSSRNVVPRRQLKLPPKQVKKEKGIVGTEFFTNTRNHNCFAVTGNAVPESQTLSDLNEHSSQDHVITSKKSRNNILIKNIIQEEKTKSKSYRKLQRRARKGLIKLLGSVDFSAHQVVGVQDRTKKPNPALRGKVLKTAYSHLRWQKKRFHSRLLGTPSQRHLIMPEITRNDWKKIIEWQLKNSFFLEEERLQPLIKDNPEKSFKIRQLNIYLPWVTIRTPLNKPFQWPLTRLDDTDYLKNHTRKESSLIELTPLTPGYKKFQSLFSTDFYKLPYSKPVSYWNSGKKTSLSQFLSSDQTSQTSSAKQSWLAKQVSKKQEKIATISVKPIIQKRILNEPYLCEPLNNQSWLLIYRLLLLFALKHLFKYIYRISLKDFVIKIANSDFGLIVISSEMREWLENTRSQSFYTPRKRLQDIAAIEDSIPTLSDIIWYLRNYGRGRKKAHGLLLVGPAGAEKTSVVQAIAGECELPVIVQSMSALRFTLDDPYERLEKVFQLARKQAPCVLFLDDLDSIGQSRAHVITNDIGAEDFLFSLDTSTAEGKLSFANLSNTLHLGNPQSRTSSQTLSCPDHKNGSTDSFLNSHWNFNPLVENPVKQPNFDFVPEQESDRKTGGHAQNGQNFVTVQQNQEFQTRKLNLLLRLLTEMDGISPLNGVVIIATSERPALLDPALVRAGRFERRIYMSLPNQERRIQLLKRETKKIGHIISMPWNYFGLRTRNMSSVDIFSAINHSAIRAILDNTVHTIETLEHGFNCVIGVPNKKIIRSAFKPTDIRQTELSCENSVSLVNVTYARTAIASKRIQAEPAAKLELRSSSSGRSAEPEQRSGLPIHLRGFAGPASPLSSSPTRHPALSEQSYRKKRQAINRSRLAFYQAGKAVLHNLLIDHIQLGVLSLDELANTMNHNSVKATSHLSREIFKVNVSKTFTSLPKQTVTSLGNSFTRSTLKSSNLNSQSKSQIISARTRIQFETQLIGLYAGKAAEMLHLSSNNICQRQQPTLGRSMKFKQRYYTQNRPITRTLQSFSHLNTYGWLWQSNLGFSELLKASSLIYFMIDRWYFYSQKLFTFKINKILSSLNHEQMKEETLFPLANRFSKELEHDLIKPGFWGITFHTNQMQEELFHNSSIPQKRNKIYWWEAKVCQALEMVERPYGKWYRIYLPKVEEREVNEEWVPPDSIIHQSLTLSNLNQRPLNSTNYSRKNRSAKEFDNRIYRQNKNAFRIHETIRELYRHKLKDFILKSKSTYALAKEDTRYFKTLNDFYLFERDFSYQNLVINCFYTAYNLLNENRELLDLFADHLIRFQIIRSHEITKICSFFFYFYESNVEESVD